MGNSDFFEKQTPQSEVKSKIVVEYFCTWAKIILRSLNTKKKHIAYFDLFAGPGRYKEGKKSTPLLVLDKIIEDEELYNHVITIFNDRKKNATILEQEIFKTTGIDNLIYKPDIRHNDVVKYWTKQFDDMSLVPSLFFLDPWGYKGITRTFIDSILKNFGCDCIFFFNYNRINPALGNPGVYKNMELLFGNEGVRLLQGKINDLKPSNREKVILEEMEHTLSDTYKKFVIKFRFLDNFGSKTSHYIFLVSTHKLAYNKMKIIMGKNSSSYYDDEIPSFEFNPIPIQMDFHEPEYSIEKLKKELCSDFNGRSINRDRIFEQHNYGTPYLMKNYNKALTELETERRIEISTNSRNRRKGTFGQTVTIKFP